MRISSSCLTRVKIVGKRVYSIIVVLESHGNESYRYLVQDIDENGVPFQVLYESTFCTSQSAKDYFDAVVAVVLAEKHFETVQRRNLEHPKGWDVAETSTEIQRNEVW